MAQKAADTTSKRAHRAHRCQGKQKQQQSVIRNAVAFLSRHKRLSNLFIAVISTTRSNSVSNSPSPRLPGLSQCWPRKGFRVCSTVSFAYETTRLAESAQVQSELI